MVDHGHHDGSDDRYDVQLLLLGDMNARFATRTLLLWTLPIIALSCRAVGGHRDPACSACFNWASILRWALGLGGYNLLIFNFIIGDTPKADRPMYVAVFSALTGATGFHRAVIRRHDI